MSIKDIIRSAKDQDPVDFRASVEAELAGRLTQRLDDKKIELAQSVFSQPPEEEDTSDDEV